MDQVNNNSNYKFVNLYYFIYYNIIIIIIGSDPEVWQKVSILSLNLVKEFPDADTLNLGGGYKVGRMSYEKSVGFLQYCNI